MQRISDSLPFLQTAFTEHNNKLAESMYVLLQFFSFGNEKQPFLQTAFTEHNNKLAESM